MLLVEIRAKKAFLCWRKSKKGQWKEMWSSELKNKNLATKGVRLPPRNVHRWLPLDLVLLLLPSIISGLRMGCEKPIGPREQSIYSLADTSAEVIASETPYFLPSDSAFAAIGVVTPCIQEAASTPAWFLNRNILTRGAEWQSRTWDFDLPGGKGSSMSTFFSPWYGWLTDKKTGMLIAGRKVSRTGEKTQVQLKKEVPGESRDKHGCLCLKGCIRDTRPYPTPCLPRSMVLFGFPTL